MCVYVCACLQCVRDWSARCMRSSCVAWSKRRPRVEAAMGRLSRCCVVKFHRTSLLFSPIFRTPQHVLPPTSIPLSWAPFSVGHEKNLQLLAACFASRTRIHFNIVCFWWYSSRICPPLGYQTLLLGLRGFVIGCIAGGGNEQRGKGKKKKKRASEGEQSRRRLPPSPRRPNDPNGSPAHVTHIRRHPPASLLLTKYALNEGL
jgi:hypothetical protein